MRKVYLNNIPRQEALERFLNETKIPRQTEELPTAEALGRITAAPVFAVMSMPGYHAAAMDGIAVAAEKTFGASDQNPLMLTDSTEAEAKTEVETETEAKAAADDDADAADAAPQPHASAAGFVYVDTGHPLPPGFDAVIKIEDIQQLPGGGVEIMAPATPWQHVRAVGEDVVTGELLVPACHCLRPPDLGALLAGGVTSVTVLKKPKAIIIPTGSDLVAPDAPRRHGAVPDFNSTVIAAYLQEWGAEPVIFPITPDDPAALADMVKKGAATGDLVLVLAGSSAGSKDFTSQVIGSLGKIFIHGVATRPGKPTILGKIEGASDREDITKDIPGDNIRNNHEDNTGNNINTNNILNNIAKDNTGNITGNNTGNVSKDIPVAGLPGYPVSAYLSLEWFIKPLIYSYLGQVLPVREKLPVTLGRRVVSEVGTEEHVRMTVGFINGSYIANPLTRGAGVTMSLVKADGILIIPPELIGHEQGETVTIELYRPAAHLKNNLLAAGSHDLIIDLLAATIRERHREISLSSAHLGSMGGIGAIGKGQAHIAGIHLFDAGSNEYNIPFVKKYLPGQDVVLVTLAHRMQGWILPPGNPDQVRELSCLIEKNLPFVNRQKGAGTRILFDHLLKQGGYHDEQVNGYHREEHTHLNVAAAVAAGTARAGLGIMPGAKAFGLDFVPVGEERYDLLMSADFYHSPPGQVVLNIITDREFQKTVEKMGGYSMREAGGVRGERLEVRGCSERKESV